MDKAVKWLFTHGTKTGRKHIKKVSILLRFLLGLIGLGFSQLKLFPVFTGAGLAFRGPRPNEPESPLARMSKSKSLKW